MKIGCVIYPDWSLCGIKEDPCTPEIKAVIKEVWPEPVDFEIHTMPNNQVEIENLLCYLADYGHCGLILTAGGTGPSSKDITPEATKMVIEKELPGFGEAMRSVTSQKVPTVIISRATAGTRGRSLILNLPGNPKSIRESLLHLVPVIREVLRQLSD
ncbi:MAG: molybdopterin-binding protein [Methylacidiphilales bacterium]|nr:molybdopterin-binding protein [Candidatus Methylacidiphilales bacterium]